MLAYSIRRLISTVPTLWLVLTLTFFLMRLAPGGPFDSDRKWPPDVQANIDRKYELDRPVYVQYAHWLGSAAHGDLRESFQYLGQPVSRIIGQSLATSMELGVLALVFSLLAGIPLGCLAAWKRGTWLDFSSMFLAIAGVSLPSFLVAALLVLLFSFWLKILPPALWDDWTCMILPVVTLGSRPMAVIARLTRASMLEALQSDYIRTALGKGVSDQAVVMKHALRNSLIPVLSVTGPIAASLVTGSLLVETVFDVPGLGKHFVQAVLNRDYPLIMGVTLVYGALLIGFNLAIDLLQAWADPRIQLERGLGGGR